MIATFGVFMVLLQIGIQVGWASPNLAKASQPDADISLNKEQMSWVVSLIGIGGIFGSVIGSFCIEFFGSKKSVLLTCVVISISWCCMIFANSVEYLYAGRFIGGMTTTMAFSSFPLYLGEVSPSHFRGTVISIAASGNPLGIVIGTIAETYLPMKLCSSVYLAMTAMTAILFMWLMDSPYYHVKRGNVKDASKAVALYYVNCDVQKKLSEIKLFVEVEGKRNFMSKLQDLKRFDVRRSIFIIIAIFCFPQFSGMCTLSSYMESILISAKTSLIKPEEFVIYVNIVGVVATFLTIRLIDSKGRRVLLIASSLGTAAAMAILGVHFYLLKIDYNSRNLQWLPVVSIILYVIAYAIGFTPVPGTVLSELFPEDVKSTAAFLASMSAAASSFIASKSYQPIVDWFGPSWVFWIYAILSLSATPFALFILPETKRKTLQQIQNDLLRT